VEDKNVTRRLAEFVVRTEYDDLPPEAIKAAKMMFLDTLACGIAGYVFSKEEVAPVFKVIEEIGGQEECTLLVSGKKTSWFNAILANGTLMHSIDYDNTRIGAMVHPAAVVVPAVLTFSEKLGSSGKETILAAVLANEVIYRTAMSVMPTHFDFWHSTGTNGTFGAAVAAGKLLGLNADEMEKAIGIAADQASGFARCVEFGDLTKSLHAGLTSAKGALSAILVKYGATGPKGILEYPRGYCSAYSKEPKVEKIVHDLGKSFDIVNNYPKFYPSNLGTHCAIQAALKIIRTNNISADEVLRVNVNIFSLAVALLSNRQLDTSLSARMSLPYCVAVTIIDNELGMDQFKRERLRDHNIKELMNNIDLQADPEFDKYFPEMYPTSVEIMTKDGQRFSEVEYYPKGFLKNPISEEEMENKFDSLCSYAFEKRSINDLKGTIQQMESLKNIFELMKLLKGDKHVSKKG